MELKMQISSGRGPGECEMVVSRILEIVIKEAEKKGIQIVSVDKSEGIKKNTLKSVELALKGQNLEVFRKRWEGSVKWIGQSPFRPKHKRKNWFINVSFLNTLDELKWNDDEFRFETMRSSGPGGQHVNKTCSAVRAVHVPTGISSVSSDERSQLLNKKTAKRRVIEMLEKNKADKENEEIKLKWDNHNSLERGNAVLVFEGTSFKEKEIS